MTRSRQQQLGLLEVFFKDHPHITFATPASPNYPKLREVFSLDQGAIPLAIVRPQSATDVSLILKHCKASNTKFVIRSGGHSLFGQSMVEGALTIDMRDIKYVKVDKEQHFAKIGGGVIQGDLGLQLWDQGFMTSMGITPSVGYVGWAVYGGYGPFSPDFGLGVDQIIEATVVNSNGDIIKADDAMLKGIRGTGGIFGPIVELTIKIYPNVKILTGVIMFDSTDISETYQRYSAGYEELRQKGLPPALMAQQSAINTPMGTLFGILFVWHSDDVALGHEWVSKISKLGGPVVFSTVAEKELPVWMEENSRLVPPAAYGSSRTHSMSTISSEAAKTIGKILEKMPKDNTTMFSIHELRGPSAQPHNNSVFGIRIPHFMLEILGVVSQEQNREEAASWTSKAWRDLSTADPENLLPETYILLDPPASFRGQDHLTRNYGSSSDEILTLKKKYDKDNFFDNAIPRLEDYM